MISREQQAVLVNAWNAADDATQRPQIQQMIRAEVARIHHAFSRLPIAVAFVEHDPYSSFEQMRDQVLSTGQMLVWTGASDTPLWSPQTNWMARAVHDYDHIQKSCDFSMEGEAAAYRAAASCTPGLAPLYLSEIMLQAAVANYTGAFVPQKLVIAPEALQAKALQMRGTPKAHYRKHETSLSPASQSVWTTAGFLRSGGQELAMIHLRTLGLDFAESMILIDAAQELNKRVDNGTVHEIERAGFSKFDGAAVHLYAERVPLDKLGYDAHGRYWGRTNEHLYFVHTLDGEISDYVRAKYAPEAREKVRVRYTKRIKRAG